MFDIPWKAPLLPVSGLVFIFTCVVLIVGGFLIYPNRKKFLLAVGIFIGAWQGGLWVKSINMDLTLVHFVFLGLLVWTFVEPNKSKNSRQRFARLLLPWLLMVGWSVLSVPGAIDADAARGGAARFVFDVVAFVTVLRLLKTPRDHRFFVFCIAAAIIGQSFLGLLQFKFSYFKFGVIDETSTWMWWRSRGTFFHPNELGVFFVILLPVVLRASIASMAVQDQRGLLLNGASLLAGGLALLTTYNRGAWVGFAIGFVSMISLDLIGRGGKIKRIAMGILVVGAAAGVLASFKFGNLILERMFHSDAEMMWEGRKELQKEAIETVRAHPILGVGYFNDRFYAKVLFAHNLYLLVAAESGIPGLFFFIWFLGEFLWLIVMGCRSRIPLVVNYSRGLLATFVGFTIASIPGPDFWVNESVQLYFWMAVAMTVSLRQMEQDVLIQRRKASLAEKYKPRSTLRETDEPIARKDPKSVDMRFKDLDN